MINVNQITSQLARMPDQALQQYAMMHKNDPYTVSLALSESNRRKQMRDAAQGQQGMAPQPKVVDQGIASMAAPAPQPQMPQAQAQPMPEDVGIGALPAPNMQGMAGGGIVAFGDGGDVQHFQSGGSAFERWLRSNTTPTEQKRFESLQAQAEANRVVPAPESLLDQAARNRQLVADQGFTRGDVRFPEGLTLDTPPVPTVKLPPVDGAGGPRPAPALAAAAPAGLTYLEQLAKTKKAMGPDVNPEQAAMETLIRERNKSATDAKTELQADIAARANQFQGREERTNKRQAELDKSKDANTGMALLEAGVAMMQARGPGLAGIAQGAGVGLKQYTSGLKDLKTAQEKLDEARDRTDELKQNQSMMDKKDVRAANKDIRDASLSGQQYLIDARMKIHGESKADARAAVVSDITAQQSALDRQSRERVAGMPSGVERMAMQLGGKGGLEAGLKKYSELMGVGTEGKGLNALIANYAKDPTALKILEASDPALAELVKQQMQQMLLQPQNKPTGQVRVGQ
jgi:hypothetical protein